MFCRKCGVENQAGRKFCSQCGAALGKMADSGIQGLKSGAEASLEDTSSNSEGISVHQRFTMEAACQALDDLIERQRKKQNSPDLPESMKELIKTIKNG